MEERRRPQTPPDAPRYLRQLPLLNLLDRLPIAMLGVGRNGEIAYANPAFAELLGYANAQSTNRLELPTLLRGREELTPADCVHILRTTTAVVEWNHDHGYGLRTMMSPPPLMRANNPLLLIGINDVTAWY